ncbi:hypothetical protein ACSBR1_008577 [Camellia fascicularis]
MESSKSYTTGVSCTSGGSCLSICLQIGVEVRTHLPDLSIRRWKHVYKEVTAPMMQCLTDQFDMQGESTDVNKVVVTKCGRSLSNHTYKLRKKYLNLKATFVLGDRMEGIDSEGINSERIDSEGINSEELLNYFYIK